MLWRSLWVYSFVSQYKILVMGIRAAEAQLCSVMSVQFDPLKLIRLCLFRNLQNSVVESPSRWTAQIPVGLFDSLAELRVSMLGSLSFWELELLQCQFIIEVWLQCQPLDGFNNIYKPNVQSGLGTWRTGLRDTCRGRLASEVLVFKCWKN